jgi:hypothetical protein
MRPPDLDPHRMLGWASAFGLGLRTALRWAAQHTGMPVMLVAALAVVLSWHAFRRAVRLSLEVLLAVVALFAATRLGWISW